MSVRSDLPTGTVTFLFTDVEGSTKLLHTLGSDAYAAALDEHRRILREAFARHGGVEVDTQGDAFFVAFPTAPGALRAAAEATQALSDGPIRVRIGLHTGTPLLGEEGYIGEDVHKGARIAAAGHGGQILVSTATAALLPGTELRDLGLHRLKDLSAAERIYQADPDAHPPLKTLHQTNLPVPATPFLGREAELNELTALLTRDSVRVLTLTGPGGTGKTRLALQAAAAAAEHFSGGVWWVPLAPLRDPALVLSTAASALGASGELADHIGDAPMLILFDNFEHLVAAAEDIGDLLGHCPNLTILVTSREPLHLAGEHEYGVDPLEPSQAVELFLTRAMAVRRDFSANGEVARICARLDHLPLAIELAAARVKVLTPQALLERLEHRLPILAGGARDAPERQRTLRATIEWSHELLRADEQRLFLGLAVFRGGWTLEAAGAIVDADLDTLQSLVDKSLVRVRPESGRFWMLETIREFAVERLEASDDASDTRERHAGFFLAMAEDTFPHLRGDPQRWLEALDGEHDNLRAALDWLAASGDGERAVQLAGALWKFWMLRGHITEGGSRLEAVLAASPKPTPHRGRALVGAGGFAAARGEGQVSRRFSREAIELYRALDDPDGLANASFMLGNSLNESEDFAGAVGPLEEALRLFTELGDDHYILLTTFHLGWAYSMTGEEEKAREMDEANLVRARRVGNKRMEALASEGVAGYLMDDGRYAEAVGLLASALPVYVAVGDRLKVLDNLARLAEGLLMLGRADVAVRVLAHADAQHADFGVPQTPYFVHRRERVISAGREALGEGFDEVWQSGSGMTPDAAVELALGSASEIG